MVTLYFAEGVLTGMMGTVLLSYRREAETLSCRTGLLRLFTPQTKTCLRGPRSAATSWRVYRFGQDGFLWPSRWSGMIVPIGHHSALIALVASRYGTV